VDRKSFIQQRLYFLPFGGKNALVREFGEQSQTVRLGIIFPMPQSM